MIGVHLEEVFETCTRHLRPTRGLVDTSLIIERGLVLIVDGERRLAERLRIGPVLLGERALTELVENCDLQLPMLRFADVE